MDSSKKVCVRCLNFIESNNLVISKTNMFYHQICAESFDSNTYSDDEEIVIPVKSKHNKKVDKPTIVESLIMEQKNKNKVEPLVLEPINKFDPNSKINNFSKIGPFPDIKQVPDIDQFPDTDQFNNVKKMFVLKTDTWYPWEPDYNNLDDVPVKINKNNSGLSDDKMIDIIGKYFEKALAGDEDDFDFNDHINQSVNKVEDDAEKSW